MADRARSPDSHRHKKDKKDKKDHKEHKHKKHGDGEHHSSSKHHKHHHDKAHRSRSRSPPRGEHSSCCDVIMTSTGRSRSRTPPARGGERRDVFAGPMPELFSIHHGKVTRTESFGAFVQLDGFSKQGMRMIVVASLLTLSQD